ncbi:Transmembrane domain-containing protein [Orpheovirus IHUMI-LCC2]|uniref:Transmembrane domain-containing protein n=1 Tax=Orpheovirus IHUMI-LCC2 TaxID=2023057 RepID=A0A2I2L3J9_9VIRU|nr:Transmembrane domain-containing protein [Orpheovirus IHUMI-LCC2]SNW62097.1 Transmembrane domain-containing protein [Orpheovirus IHUMI-LCC2]
MSIEEGIIMSQEGGELALYTLKGMGICTGVAMLLVVRGFVKAAKRDAQSFFGAILLFPLYPVVGCLAGFGYGLYRKYMK